LNNSFGCPWCRTRIAPPEASAIVRAHMCRLCHRGLHQAPVQRRASKAALRDNCRTAFASALEVKPVPAHVYEPAGRRISQLVLLFVQSAQVGKVAQWHELDGEAASAAQQLVALAIDTQRL